MTLRPLLAALACGVLCLSLVGCDTSTGVGAEIGEDLEGGDPQAIDLVANSSSFGATEISAPITGNTQSRDWRVLVGRVFDPAAGEATAHGYLDFSRPASLPNAILESSADRLEASLNLAPGYLHGDSTATLEVTLYSLTNNEDFEDARSDTSFTVGAPIETYEISAAEDSLVTLDLPASWLAENLDALTDTTDAFSDRVTGLKLEVTGPTSPTAGAPGAVLGFTTRNAETSLEIARADETSSASYGISQSFTEVSWSDPPSNVSGDDRALLRGGDNRALSLDFNFEETVRTEDLIGAPLNRVRLEIPLDSVRQDAGLPETFTRPQVSGYRLLLRRSGDPGVPSCESDALGQLLTQTPDSGLDPNDEEGRYCFLPADLSGLPGSVGTVAIEEAVNASLQPESPVVFESFRLEIIDRFSSSSSFNPVFPGVPTTAPVLVPTPSPDNPERPRITIVATPV